MNTLNRFSRLSLFFTSALALLISSTALGQIVYVTDGMAKYRKANSGTTGDAIPQDANICSSSGCSRGALVLSAAKNEFEPFQIYVAAPSATGLSQVDVIISDLKNANGFAGIVANSSNGKPKDIVIYRHHYLSIAANQLSSAAGFAGLVPDGLIPKIDEYFGEVRRMPGETTPAFPFNIAANNKQGIWVDVYVPTDTPAGLYTGKATVTVQKQIVASIPIQLNVRNFELPSTPSLKTAYAVGIGEMAKGHYGSTTATDDQYWELICLYTKELLLHRVSNENVIWPRPLFDSAGKPQSLKTIQTTCNERYPEFLTGNNPKLLPNDKLPGAKITRARMRDGTGLSSTGVQSVSYYQNYMRYFSDKGWKDRLFYYLWDEPPYRYMDGKRHCNLTYDEDEATKEPVTTTAWNDLYKKAKFFKDNGITVPMALTTSQQATQNCFTNYLKVPDYTRYIDTWIVPNRHMHGKSSENVPFNVNNRAIYDSLISLGKEVWWYHACGNHGCGGSETGFASPMADLPNIYSRVFEWLTYNYQIGHRGASPNTELYFETVYAYAYSSDPWTNIYHFSGHGDGTFFYPGKPSKIGGTKHIPVASIRLKMLREGIEDYEYLVILENKLNSEGKNGPDYIRTNILQPHLAAKDDKDGLTKFITYVWNRNPGSATSATGLLRAREEAANRIQGVNSDFTISTAAPSISTKIGASVTTSVAIDSIGGFKAAVALSCASAGQPNLTCTLGSPTATPPADGRINVSLTVTALSGLAAGTYQVTITGSSNGKTHSANLPVAVSTTANNGSNIGAEWNEYKPDFDLSNGEIRGVTPAASHEAQYKVSVEGPDQSVEVDCKTSQPGSSCGVMARWKDADNFYYALIDHGQDKVVLFKKVGGQFTSIAQAPRAMELNTYYRVKLIAIGSSLSVYFANEATPAIKITDTAHTTGNFGGIRAYSGATLTAFLKNYRIEKASAPTVPPPPVQVKLFEDLFNRNATGLGADWKIEIGGANTNGSSAVITGTATKAESWASVAKISPFPTADYSVEAAIAIPAGSYYTGVVARGSSGGIWTQGYVAQIDSNGNLNLYRRNINAPGGWVKFAGTKAGIVANGTTFYTLKLQVSGTNPVLLKVHLNGVEKLTYSDSSANRLTSGVPGIEAYYKNVKLDRFTVTKP